MTEIDRRTFLRAMLGAAGALTAWSCGRSSPPGSDGVASDPGAPSPRVTLRLPTSGDRGFPSPLAYGPGGYGPVSFVYDTLMWLDAAGQLQPWLAENYERSPDGLAYTFRLRENARWHDGRPVTADDVAFSFAYYQANRAKLPPFILYEPEHVRAATALDPRTVRIDLDLAAVTFPRAVAGHFPVVPRHIWEPVADPARMQDPKMLVGSGPYRLESYTPGQGSYLFVANDGFFLGRPFVKRIELRPVGDELTALRTGEVDVGSTGTSGAPVSGEALEPFRRDPEFGVVQAPPGFLTALYWNLTKGGPLTDGRFRQACARAIDREDLVERLLGGAGTPGNPGFVPPGHPFHVPVQQYRFDRGAANRLLDDAGYARGSGGIRQGPDGNPLRFRMATVPELAGVAELVVGSLRAVGIQLDVEPVDFLQFLSGQVDYQMALLLYGGVQDDPDYLRQILSSRSQKTLAFRSPRGYQNPEFDDLADRQLVTLDEAERKRLIARMQEIVAGDLPLLHLYYTLDSYAYRRGVFDQWNAASGDVYNKHLFVTGRKSGGLQIRPIAGD